MKRAEVFRAIAAVLPFGALAMIPEPVEPKVPAPDPPRNTRWLIVHAGDKDRLPFYHEQGQACHVCSYTGMPAFLWHGK